jgi:DNA replication and repair protein RecF
MSFTIKELRLENFRSHKKSVLFFDPRLTILYGPNASGKTNCIEALQLLTQGESFRKAKNKDLVQWGEEESKIALLATDGELKRNIEARFSEKGKNLSINEKNKKSLSVDGERLTSVTFTPEDLRIVKDSATRRRREIDTLGSQLSQGYSKLLQEYRKVVSHRNSLLKEGSTEGAIFEAWDERQIELGYLLSKKRSSLLKRIEPLLSGFYSQIVGQAEESKDAQELSIEYVTNWIFDDGLEGLKNEARENREKEIQRKTSLIGPLKDDISFLVDEKNAREFASQGQQRTIVLSWKLAQMSLFEEILGVKPVLLLDDVMSEFDEKRRKYLAYLAGNISQTIITTANIDYFDKDLLGRAAKLKIPEDVEIAGR